MRTECSAYVVSGVIRTCLLFAMCLLAPSIAAAQKPNECLTCHAGLQDARLSAPARAFKDDVHQQHGFVCVDCHAGDPTTPDKVKAKAPATGFRGAPRGAVQIQVCARCHSDASFMRTFAPRQRVDQAVEYASSTHGKRLAAGDTRVATCASCHGAHGIRPVADARSPVYATNVAATCATCHANPAHMKRPDGSNVSTAQLADYQKSVHYAALTKQRDLSAPTCNDCHGNHGATPPGVAAVSNVCGTCHAAFAAKFATSPHKPILDKACVDCHSNHAIAKPSEEMLAATPAGVCTPCHEGGDDPGRIGADKMRAGLERLKAAVAKTADGLQRVENAGMEMGDQTLALNKARDQLVLARTELHTFNPTVVDAVVREGLDSAAAVDRAVQQADSELRFRRRGLAVSLALTLVVVVALAIKIRQIDRRSGAA